MPTTRPKPRWRQLSQPRRWLLAVGLLLLGGTAWLETTAPAWPLPPILLAVGAAGVLCGTAPGLLVAAGGAGLVLLFATAAEAARVAAACLLTLAAALLLRRWLLRGD